MISLIHPNALEDFARAYKKQADRILSYANQTRFIVAFAVVYVSLILLLFVRTYSTCDDTAILFDIQNGYETSFFSVVLGRVLSFFYLHIHPGVPWYGLFLYSVHIASISLFLKGITRIKQFKYFLLPFLPAFLLFYARFVTKVSFNEASILLGSSCLFSFLSRGQGDQQRWKISALGVLLGISFLIRIAGLGLSIVFALPALVIAACKKKIEYRAVFFLIVAIICLALLNGAVSRYFVSDRYRAFEEFNSLRHRFHQFPIAERNAGNQELLTANHWTSQDYFFFNHFFYPDERKFNVEALKNVFRLSVPDQPRFLFFSRYFNALRSLWSQYKRDLIFLIISLSAIFLTAGSSGWVKPALYFCYAISGMVYLRIFYRFPAHVAHAVFLSVAVWLIYFCCLNSKANNRFFQKKAAFTIAALLFFVFFAVNFVRYYKDSSALEKKVSVVRQVFVELHLKHPKAVIITTSFELLSYLDPLKVYRPSFVLVPMGWKTFSPFFYDVIGRELGIKYGYEMFRKCVNNQKVFLLFPDSFAKEIFNYIEGTYDLRFHFEKVESFGSGLGLYRLLSN